MNAAPSTADDQAHAIRHWIPGPSWYKPPLCWFVVQLSRGVMQGMNRLTFEGRAEWDALFEHRARGILSFSNHVSLFDDPLLISNLGATRYDAVRWIPADHRNFFSSWLKGVVFSAGKCVPIIRGGGLGQPGFEFLLERLKAGEWVHIFPEGGRTRDPDARLRTPFKQGIGRLLVEAQPVAMPFYHRGMQELLPIGSRLPRWGKQVHVQFGRATSIDQEWIQALVPGSTAIEEMTQAATDWSEQELQRLQDQALTAPP